MHVSCSLNYFIKFLYLLSFITHCHNNTPEENKGQSFMIDNLQQSDYVTIVFTVPETHADYVREAMGKAGAGKFENYSFCSFSTKGIGRFMPNSDAHPHIGAPGILEEVIEERIETVVLKEHLEVVIETIKTAHPYESTVIDIYPIYKIGCK
jgi:hypothetical protein